MKYITLASLLLTTASVANAWRFTGWHDQQYTGRLVIDRSGGRFTQNQCYDLIINDNVMSSFKWTRGRLSRCAFKLFDGHGCTGRVLGSSTSDWNVPAISRPNDNKASSLWVDCI